MTVLVVDRRLHSTATEVLRPVGATCRGRRRPPCPDRAAEALADAGSGAIVLAPEPPEGEPVGPLIELARAMGVEAVRVPSDPGLGAWVVSLVEWLCREGYPDVLRRAQTLAGVRAANLPSSPWGAPAVLVPALRPQLLARWAWHAWTACRHCSGGAHSGAACARCGMPRS